MKIKRNYAKSIQIFGVYNGEDNFKPEDYKRYPSYPLEYIGEGNTCCCYRIKDGALKNHIIKEFYPEISKDDCIVLERTDKEMDWLVVRGDIDEENRAILDARWQSYLNSFDTVSDIRNSYSEIDANMFVVPTRYNTSLGVCYDCNDIKGKVLFSYMEELKRNKESLGLKQFLRSVLVAMYRLYNDLDKYHRAGYINLDIKLSNLLYINGEIKDDYMMIRNLDFGSCQKIEPLIDAIKADNKSTYKELRGSFFASTQEYYSVSDLEQAIRACKESSKENAEKRLKDLDLVATIRLLTYSICPLEEPKDKTILYKYIENELVKLAKKDDNLMELYNILYRLRTMILSVTREDKETNTKALMQDVAVIISILDNSPYVDASFADKCKDAIVINEQLKNKDYELDKYVFANGNRGFRELLDFCEENALRTPSALSGYLTDCSI